MSYIGLPPKATFSSGLLDRFTSTTGTTVTLTHDIASENDIVVFVNFVKQDSTTYSVGGTGNKTLTLGGTLVSSDIVEVHYLNIVGQTVAPSSGSVTTATINDNAVTGAKLNADVISSQTELASGVASTDELLISDAGVLKRVDVSLVGGDNKPYFYARKTGSVQSLSNSTSTAVQFDTEDYDTGSEYNNTNYQFVPTNGNTYLIHGQVKCGSSTTSTLQEARIQLYKNGSEVVEMRNDTYQNGSQFMSPSISKIVTGNGSDYYQIYAHIYVVGGATPRVYGGSFFTAFKLIG